MNFKNTTIGNTSLGKRIKGIRESIGFNQEQLADKATVTKAYISQLESGKRLNPYAPELLKVAKALNTTMEYLLTGQEKFKDADPGSMDDSLQEIFFELTDTNNGLSVTEDIQFRLSNEFNPGDIENIKEYIKFIKNNARKIREGQRENRDKS